MKHIFAAALITALFAAAPAQAEVKCPDMLKDKTQYLVIARGKVTYSIEPMPVLDCPMKNYFGQCPMPLGVLPNPRNRLMFKVDEYYYLNTKYLLNVPYKAGMKTDEIGGVGREMIITGAPTYVGQEAMLMSFEANQYGDFETAGCEQIILKSNPAFKEAVKRAEKLTQ